MIRDKSLLLAEAPLSELSFSIVTSDVAVDPFTIAQVHENFAASYPKVERQFPSGGIELMPVVGSGPALQEQDKGVPPRWWFISDDDTRLLQVQERFLGWNWRRQDPFDKPNNYPGYDSCADEARRCFDLLLKLSDPTEASPEFAGCQIFYDNIFPLRTSDDTAIRLGDVLTNWNSTWERPLSTYQLSWLEQIDGFDQDSRSALQVQAMAGAAIIPTRAEPLPVLKLTFVAALGGGAWSDVWPFFEAAHAHIGNRFRDLINEPFRKEVAGI